MLERSILNFLQEKHKPQQSGGMMTSDITHSSERFLIPESTPERYLFIGYLLRNQKGSPGLPVKE